MFQPASLSLKVKESHHDPVEKSQSVAEFVGAMGIEDEPVFSWWVKPVLKHRDRTIAHVAKRQANPQTHDTSTKVQYCNNPYFRF